MTWKKTSFLISAAKKMTLEGRVSLSSSLQDLNLKYKKCFIWIRQFHFKYSCMSHRTEYQKKEFAEWNSFLSNNCSEKKKKGHEVLKFQLAYIETA